MAADPVGRRASLARRLTASALAVALVGACAPEAFEDRGAPPLQAPAPSLEQALSEADFDATVQHLTALPYLPWAYTPDGCYARALYYSMALATHRVPTNHLYIVAQPGATLAGRWSYHVAPSVTLDSEGSRLYVLDPVFDATRALTVGEWASLQGYSDPRASDYPTLHVHPGNTYGLVHSPRRPLDGPEPVDPARFREPSFSALGAFEVDAIEHACRTMQRFVELEAGAGQDERPDERRDKHERLGAATRALTAALATLGKLEGSVDELSRDCLRGAYDDPADPARGPRRSFSASDVPLSIPDFDARGVASELVVTARGVGVHIAVAVRIVHGFVGDLRIALEAPDGRQLVLRDRGGGGGDDLDELYRLPALDGVELAGRWVLRVADLSPRDRGTLAAWELRANVDEGLKGDESAALGAVAADADAGPADPAPAPP